MATGTIKNSLAWQAVDSKVGTASISLPSNFNELQIEVQYGTNNIFFPFHIIRSEVESGAKVFTLGYYINASSSGFCQITVGSTSMNCLAFYINGTDYTSTARTRVWAR